MKGGNGAVFDSAAASVAVYSDHADDYALTHAPKMAGQVERFADSLPVPSLILDAGCGPGRDLARFTARGHSARGVDLNPVFVAMANAHAPTSQGDLRDVGSQFPAGTVDGIWACASLVHLRESETVDVLGQFAGLLRPGGKLYACVRSVGRTGWLDEPDGRRWYTVWDAGAFAVAVADAGFEVDHIGQGPFVEVWATRWGAGDHRAVTAAPVTPHRCRP
ncbi:class I SAM-dependent methyltransferase [Kitasatospora sp. NPDC056531]|uniref:class I SAM-dependent methyltransferase n=1 Tax=Kitasatospora sp. NPDC056531 TaxID=3345856 RepID=UPI003680A27F